MQKRGAREMNDFDQFWAVCPRKVAKLDAMKAFGQALKIATLAEIIDGMKAHAEAVRDIEPRFIPYPATWLRAGQWMDEYEQSSQVDLTKWRKPEPHEIAAYRAEHPYLDRDPEWVPKSWSAKLRIVS